MTPDQMSLARIAARELRTVSISADAPHSPESLIQVLSTEGIVSASLNLADGTATGFTHAGLESLGTLARSIRQSRETYSHLASNSTVVKVLARQLRSLLKTRASNSLAEEDFDTLDSSVHDWFQSLTRVRKHFIPCVIAPYPAQPFTIGPVTFRHISQLSRDELGMWGHTRPTARPKSPENWLQRLFSKLLNKDKKTTAPSEPQHESLLRFIRERNSPWIATVLICGRAEEESLAAADIAADISLAILQLALPSFSLRQIARATARSSPLWRAQAWKPSDGRIRERVINQEPARTISQDLFAAGIFSARDALESMGRRLASYTDSVSLLPALDEAWCNATYWYHEALAEHLETVAIAKLETSIEVLFRSESMSGSRKRMLESLDAVFGIGEHDPISSRTNVTARQFVAAIVTARSRVLHGTWPTLGTDLPGEDGQLQITYADVEPLARNLLVSFSRFLDSYQTLDSPADTTEALMRWVKERRSTAVSSEV